MTTCVLVNNIKHTHTCLFMTDLVVSNSNSNYFLTVSGFMWTKFPQLMCTSGYMV